MKIGIPKEHRESENRVAATPKTVTGLIKLGYQVLLETGAGERADFPDRAFTEAGAEIGDHAQVWGADIVLAVNKPTEAQLDLMKPGAAVVGFLNPRIDESVVDQLAKRGLTGLAMEMVPRISRAQALDALSSMANAAGYRAVVESLNYFGRFFPGQVTAAGKIPPAHVFVIGAGVAGLAAIGTANSLGAQVRATDVRPETAEQIESMGADFVGVQDPSADAAESSDGYAHGTTADYDALAAQMYAEQLKWADIVITTAAIPGKPSPRLLTAEMVDSMKPGSVIVDLAAEGGGNCELTRPNVAYVTDGGVDIVGFTDLASRLPGQSSQMYGTNLVNLLKLLTPDADGQLVLNFDDEIIRNVTVAKDGVITYPPPPVQVSAAPVAPKPPAVVEPTAAPDKPRSWRLDVAVAAVASLALIALLALMPESFLSLIGVFVLAIVVGFYVVWDVTHALHTPLMSVTNAISGIIIVGAVLQLESDNWAIRILAAIAVLIASINIFGGFAVTNRMLSMFRKDAQ